MSNKYHARRTYSTICDRWFSSKAEAERGDTLFLMQKAGLIEGLEFQPKYTLCWKPTVTYTGDFRYWVPPKGELGCVLHVEDVKGLDTDASRVRRAWVKDKYGIEVELIR